ncbi:MAG: chemotaxis protein CheB [Actinomycetota bacterium]
MTARAVGLVTVGCSWGGLIALERLLPTVPSRVRAPIVIAQHRVAQASPLASLLGRFTTRPVTEAEDKEAICPDRVYLAPPDYHLLVEPGHFALSTEGPVRYSRPSIDALFESAADAYADRLVAIVLTGANDDGADGARAVARRGGRVVVQNPTTAERDVMPAAALEAVPNATVLPVEEIGLWLADLWREVPA